MTCRYLTPGVIKTVGFLCSRDESGGPADWPGGDRHGGDVSLACCFRMELGKVHPETTACSRRDREPLKQQKLREVEYRCVGALADQLVVVMNPLQ